MYMGCVDVVFVCGDGCEFVFLEFIPMVDSTDLQLLLRN